MWKRTFITIWSISLSSLVSFSLLGEGSLPLGPKTALIFKSYSGPNESQLIVRVARFRPDIVMEWESVSSQGTIHLLRNNVINGANFTLLGHFDPGVDMISKEVMTVWFSKKIYNGLVENGSVKIKINRFVRMIYLEEEDVFQLKLNKRGYQIPVLRLKDDRGAVWKLLKDPANPILVEYSERDYRIFLSSVQTDLRIPLRWIRKLPPVK